MLEDCSKDRLYKSIDTKEIQYTMFFA